MIGGQLHIGEVGLSDNACDDLRHFGVRQVALAEQFVGLLSVKSRLSKASATTAPISREAIGGNRQIRAEWPSRFSDIPDDASLCQCVFHEIAGTNVKGLQMGDLSLSLFQMM